MMCFPLAAVAEQNKNIKALINITRILLNAGIQNEKGMDFLIS
jgi:hypothetical protein